MLFYQELELAILLIIAFVYAMFDVFNKRNVPNVFVYFTIALGVVIALLANRGEMLLLDFGIAAIVALLGYALYRNGFLGGGDVLEFVFISLVMPLQSQPFYLATYQSYVPFIISVLIGAGYTSLVFIPLYYLGIKRSSNMKVATTSRSRAVGAVFFIAYIAFLIVLKYTVGVSIVGILLIVLLAVVSAITMTYEKRIYLGMVSFIQPKQLEEGDMIATNLMSKQDIKVFSGKTKFGRLATKKLISQIRNVNRKLPVYKDSVPFSLFILLGIIISLLFGNLILAIVQI